MKKIFALALAGVMTAGMTTVAFAKNEESPYLVNADGNTNMYVLNDNEAAVKDIVGNDGYVEGGDEIAISDVELDEKTKTEDDTSSTTDGGKENPDSGR